MLNLVTVKIHFLYDFTSRTGIYSRVNQTKYYYIIIDFYFDPNKLFLQTTTKKTRLFLFSLVQSALDLFSFCNYGNNFLLRKKDINVPKTEIK